MMQQLRVPAAEFDSILRLIHSQLDVSIIRMLGGTEEPPGSPEAADPDNPVPPADSA